MKNNPHLTEAAVAAMPFTGVDADINQGRHIGPSTMGGQSFRDAAKPPSSTPAPTPAGPFRETVQVGTRPAASSGVRVRPQAPGMSPAPAFPAQAPKLPPSLGALAAKLPAGKPKLVSALAGSGSFRGLLRKAV